MSVLDRWIEKTGAEDKPSIGLPGLGSDYAPFTHLSGIPIVDVGFSQTVRKISSYSTYHTGYDNFQYVKMIDPGFKGDSELYDIQSGGNPHKGSV